MPLAYPWLALLIYPGQTGKLARPCCTGIITSPLKYVGLALMPFLSSRGKILYLRPGADKAVTYLGHYLPPLLGLCRYIVVALHYSVGASNVAWNARGILLPSSGTSVAGVGRLMPLGSE